VTDRYLGVLNDPGALPGSGIRARLRRTGQRVELTVKRTGVLRGSVTTRAELEAPATRSLDPRRWPPSAARALLESATAGQPLVEIACLRQSRLTRVFARGDTRVEVSLDALSALDGEGRVLARRHELEAELLEGDERALQGLADALCRLDGIVPPLGSKLLFALESRRRAPAPVTDADPDRPGG
jgi:inorganic triphosphatase YgiF